MDVLPKDIRSIIYRYLFVCTYDTVVHQYREQWLTDRDEARQHNHQIYWDDAESLFCTRENYVANYRTSRRIDDFDGAIFHFRSYRTVLLRLGDTRCRAVLSNNYEYMQIWCKNNRESSA
jgi:hypothetical protein